MTGIGVLLIVLGVGSLLLPLFDMQFRLMEFVDPYQPWAGLIVGVIGAVLVGMRPAAVASCGDHRSSSTPSRCCDSAPGGGCSGDCRHHGRRAVDGALAARQPADTVAPTSDLNPPDSGREAPAVR